MMLVLVIVALLTHLPSMSSPAAWRPPRKMMIGPLTPAGAQWMCDCVILTPSLTWSWKSIAVSSLLRLKNAFPEVSVTTGGTSWSPVRVALNNSSAPATPAMPSPAASTHTVRRTFDLRTAPSLIGRTST